MQSACKIALFAVLTLLPMVSLGGCNPATNSTSPYSRQSPPATNSDKKEPSSVNSDTKEPTSAAASPKLEKLDLPIGKVIMSPMTIEVPEGATARDDVIEIIVKSKPPFMLQIRQKAGELSKRVKADTGGKEVKYLTDSADTKFIESEKFGQKAWSFWTEVKAGDTTYQVRGGLQPATREEVELQLKCAKTLASKK